MAGLSKVTLRLSFDNTPFLGIIIPEMSITVYERKLSAYLFNKTKRSLLALFFGHPDESFYVNQIQQRLGSGSGAVQRELKLMTDAGVIIRERRGNLVYYQANAKSPVFEELKNIVRKTFGVADVIRDCLAAISKNISVAFIFGSVASSTDGKASDIDVMVIGDVSFAEVSSAVSQAEKLIRREINPVVYSPVEFGQKVKEESHFVKSVLEGEKIFLLGDNNEFGRLAERGTPQAA